MKAPYGLEIVDNCTECPHMNPSYFCAVSKSALRSIDGISHKSILPAGAIDPDQVHTPGIFVHRLVKVPPPPEGLWPTRRQERRR